MPHQNFYQARNRYEEYESFAVLASAARLRTLVAGGCTEYARQGQGNSDGWPNLPPAREKMPSRHGRYRSQLVSKAALPNRRDAAVSGKSRRRQRNGGLAAHCQVAVQSVFEFPDQLDHIQFLGRREPDQIYRWVYGRS